MPEDMEHKKMIQLINHLPEVTDLRSKEEIYRKVKKNMDEKPKRKKRYLVIPALSSIAAILIFLLVSPILFQQQSYKESSVADRHRIVTEGNENKAMELNDNSSTMQAQEESGQTSQLRTALYKEDIENQQVFTYASLTNDGGLVPVSVSILVPKEEGLEWFEQYKKEATIIQKKAPDLMNIEPILDSIVIENPTTARVRIDDEFRENFSYQNGLNDFIQNTFQYTDIQAVQFTDQAGNPVEFGNNGIVQDQEIEKQPHRAQYLYELDSGEAYIVSESRSTEDNFSATLHDMKDRPNDFLQTIIPKDIHFDVVKEKDREVTILFHSSLDLSKGDQQEHMWMIEGILLAAKEYGFQSVQFEGIEPQHWEGFDFEQPVEVPIAPNVLK